MQKLAIDKEALEEKTEELLEKVAEKKKVGMFRGIQSRVMIALVVTMLVSAGFITFMAIERFSDSLSQRVNSEMLGLAKVYCRYC